MRSVGIEVDDLLQRITLRYNSRQDIFETHRTHLLFSTSSRVSIIGETCRKEDYQRLLTRKCLASVPTIVPHGTKR